MSFYDDVAAAIWAYSSRTVDGLGVPASDGTKLDDIRYAIWTRSVRTLDGAPGPVTGTGAWTLESVEANGSGNVVLSITGTGAWTTESVEAAASGSLGFAGTAALTLESVELGASGEVQFTGTASLTLESIEAAASGSLGFEGTGAATLEAVQTTANGTVVLEFTGTGTLALEAVEMTADGTVGAAAFTGTAALEVEAVEASGTGDVERFARFWLKERLRVWGRLYVSDQIETRKIMITPEGGFAVKLGNKTGQTILHGTAVSASPDHDGCVVPQAGEYDCVGAAYGNILTNQDGWVVTTGIAEFLLKNSTAATRGYWAKAADTDGRIVVTTAPAGIGALSTAEHFREIGHCLESKAGGTDVLVKILLHFL